MKGWAWQVIPGIALFGGMTCSAIEKVLGFSSALTAFIGLVLIITTVGWNATKTKN